jgi:dTDP-4-amino-4,6-dideoxygalactose transaminase
VAIPWSLPAFDDAEESAVLETLRSGWLTMGPRTRAFERGIAQLLGVEHAVAVSSGTAALDVALAALGIGPGDEVIVPAFTYVATVNAVTYQGATPVMVDVEPETLNLDPRAVRAHIGPRTRAIVPIDYGGCAADYDALEPLALAAGVVLLQDAAHSLGGTHRGRPPGAFGIGATLSFHVSKLITAVEGGMIVTNDGGFAERARTLRNQGEPAGAKYSFTMVGHNYRLSDLHAAIGLAQLAKLPHLLARRREVSGWYRAALGGRAGLTLLAEPAAVGHGHFLFSILCGDRCARDRAAAALGHRGIETRICWPLPVYRQPAYAGRSLPRIPCPVAESVADRVLSLPMHSGLTQADVDHICDVLRAALD